MKIRPRLKTHWLASQNPLMASLDQLKYVVFCPPENAIDFGFSVESLPKKTIALKSNTQFISPATHELQDVMSRSHTLSRDLFWSLFSGYEIQNFKAQPQMLRDLATSLEFHYENQESFSLVSLYRKQGLPPFLNPQFYLQDRSCRWEQVLSDDSEVLMRPLKLKTSQKKNEEFKKTWIVILEILAWALQRQRQIGDLEVLIAPNSSETSERFAYSLTDIEFVKARPLAATLMADSEMKSSVRLTVWQGIEQDHQDSILKLYSMNSIYDELNSTELTDFQPEELLVLQKNSNLNWTRLFTTSFHDSGQVVKAIEHLKQKIATDHIHFINHHLITGAQFKPLIQLREFDGSLKMAVRFKIEDTNLFHLNFPQYFKNLMGPFVGGLETFMGLDRKDLASKQAQYRQNDLLILRHQGVALFCLLDLINFKLDRALTSGEVIEHISDIESPDFDRQFQKVVNYFKASIPGLLGKSNEKFEYLFSAEVKSYFLDFLEKLYFNLHHDLNLIFQSKQIFEIKNIHQQVLTLVRFLILHLVEESGGKVLMKSQSTIGDHFKNDLLGWNKFQIISEDFFEKGFEPLWVDIGLYTRGVIHLLFDLIDHQIEVEFNGVPFLSKDNPFEFIFNIKSSENKEDANWFDLHPQIFFNGQPISSDQVQLNFTADQIGFIEFQGQIYRIDKKQVPSMKALQKFWERIKGQKNKVTRNLFGDRVFRLEKSVALELLMLKVQGIQVQADGEWKRIFDYFENGLGIEKINLPATIQKSLLPHQLEGAQWLNDLYELRLGALLADEMGLGKTFQVLAFLESQNLKSQLGHSLVVVPTSLVYNWIDEKKKFSPDLPLEVFQSADKEKIKNLLSEEKNKVIIATYGLLNENCEFFESIPWNIVVFDEAQNLKNITSVRAVSARKLNARFKVCLTGTPMENNYLEFYSLCDLIVPGCLGEIDEFRKNYFNNEVRNESLQKLRLITKPLLLRRTKSQVKLNLPVKTVQEVVLPFPEKQKEIYKKMALSFSRQVDDLIQQSGENKAQIAMFAALMRLRQICSDPAAVPGVDFKEKPIKVQHFLTSLQEHLENGESVIVFTQFLSTLNRIEFELKKATVPFYTLQGKISSKERIKLISAFQKSDEPSVMLMTLKTGGVGLNLTKASVVYHLEPWWNPAVENQATDRAHRMGQTKDVKVFNLLIEGSLEQRISELKVKKQSSFDRLFSVDEQLDESAFESSQSLSREDFLFLLKSSI